MSDSADVTEPDPEELRAAVERFLDETVDRDESVRVDVDDLSVSVPTRFGEDAPRANWQLNGGVTVTVDGIRQPLREWLDIFEDAYEKRTD